MISGILFAEGNWYSSHTNLFNRLGLAALMVRTWAVWHHNRYVGGGLAILWIGIAVTACYITSDFARSFARK
jgi:hypothetical protein